MSITVRGSKSQTSKLKGGAAACALLLALWAMPARAQGTAAPAQRPAQAPPAARSPNNAPSAATQGAERPNAPAQPAAKKSNARPSVTQKKPATGEPFDGATAQQMAAQCVTLETDAGEIVIEMLAEAAPTTARNFLNLAATGALDTTTFSRVVKGFVVQGGNLGTSQKWGAALAERANRHVPDEPNFVKHVRGVVSLARSSEPNSGTTHFFILVGDAPHLDGKFAAFGRVTRGMEIADLMNNAPTEGEKPAKPVRINRALVKPCVGTGQ